MKQIILALMLAVAGIGVAVAANPIREGNMISGHVLVKGSEENIPYATVLIVGSGQGTVSNEEGQFEFKNLPAGKYTLRVSAVGYKTQEKAIEVNKDFTAVVHFQMEEESFMTDEVVVSANRNEVSRKAAPVVVNVMSAKLFEMVNSTDLAKTLNYQSGLRVENNCQNCGFPQVRINGLEGPYSQILINSRPVISALSGVYGLEQIPVNMIERVEVVRGGGSALFGANAVGGTINIITKDPINNSFQVSSMFSNMDGKSWEQYMGGNVSLVSKDNSYGIALYESYRNRNPYDRDGDGFSELGKLNMNTFGFRAYYRPTHFSRINLEYHTTNEFRRGGNKFDLQPHEADITEQTKHIINSGGLSYDLFWREYKHKISLYGSHRPQQLLRRTEGHERLRQDGRPDVGGRRHVRGQHEQLPFRPRHLHGRTGVSEQLPARCHDGLSPRYAAGCTHCQRLRAERVEDERIDHARRRPPGQAQPDRQTDIQSPRQPAL